MSLKKIGLALLAALVTGAAWRASGWPGVALAAAVIVMWLLLHFTQLMKVLQRASAHPLGWCESAVMLNAKLRRGINLLHVVAMTRALGEQISPDGVQPEVFRWTDGGGSHVTCQFAKGELVSWTLERPRQGREAGQ